MPIDIIDDRFLIAARVQNDIWYKLRILPTARNPDHGAKWINWTESVCFSCDGGLSSVPGSIFHASHSLGLSTHAWS